MKFRTDMPEKYKSKIMTVGFLDAHDDHKSRLELDFENGMKLTIYDVSEEEYIKLNNCSHGHEYYFADVIYPTYKDQIEMIKQ